MKCCRDRIDAIATAPPSWLSCAGSQPTREPQQHARSNAVHADTRFGRIELEEPGPLLRSFCGLWCRDHDVLTVPCDFLVDWLEDVGMTGCDTRRRCLVAGR